MLFHKCCTCKSFNITFLLGILNDCISILKRPSADGEQLFPEYDRIKPQESNMAARSFHAGLAHKPEKSNVLNWLLRFLLHYAAHRACEVVTLPIMTLTPMMHDNASANQYELVFLGLWNFFFQNVH